MCSWALITGASSGIGLAKARLLAKRGYSLILVARRAERLNDLAAELDTEVRVFTLDLADANAREALLEQLETEQLLPELLINNAGMGIHGPMAEQSWSELNQLLQLNLVAVSHLCHWFVRQPKAKYLLNVGSVVSFLPFPNYGLYAASKAAVLSISLALHQEVLHQGIRVCCLCPGTTATEFFEVSNQQLKKSQQLLLMDATKVADNGLTALLDKNQPLTVPGLANRLLLLLVGCLPIKLQAKVATKMN